MGTELMITFIIKRINGFKNGKGYVLTKDNYIKIISIIRKALLRIPVIISGETGCGKTHLVDFVASCLLGDEFRCFTLNAGVTQQ